MSRSGERSAPTQAPSPFPATASSPFPATASCPVDFLTLNAAPLKPDKKFPTSYTRLPKIKDFPCTKKIACVKLN